MHATQIYFIFREFFGALSEKTRVSDPRFFQRIFPRVDRPIKPALNLDPNRGKFFLELAANLRVQLRNAQRPAFFFVKKGLE